MRYFIDTEFNGFGGALLSIALVPEHGEEFYAVIEPTVPIEPWVETHVMPFLHHVPFALQTAAVSREEAAHAMASYLFAGPRPLIVADWPEDVAQFCNLLLIGSGLMVPVPELEFQLLPLPGFSPSVNSAVPHNALHDARALRDHVLSLE